MVQPPPIPQPQVARPSGFGPQYNPQYVPPISQQAKTPFSYQQPLEKEGLPSNYPIEKGSKIQPQSFPQQDNVEINKPIEEFPNSSDYPRYSETPNFPEFPEYPQSSENLQNEKPLGYESNLKEQMEKENNGEKQQEQENSGSIEPNIPDYFEPIESMFPEEIAEESNFEEPMEIKEKEPGEKINPGGEKSKNHENGILNLGVLKFGPPQPEVVKKLLMSKPKSIDEKKDFFDKSLKELGKFLFSKIASSPKEIQEKATLSKNFKTFIDFMEKEKNNA